MDDFSVHELVCPHVYRLHGDRAISFADPRLLKWLAWFRSAIDKPVIVNDYYWQGNFTQRGYRCNLCPIVSDNSRKSILYASAHTRFQAVDFDITDMNPEEIRQWLDRNKYEMPEKIRIERATPTWVHVDVCNDGVDMIKWFNP